MVDPMQEPDAWKEKILRNRAEKDRYLSKDEKSPIPQEKRGNFKGLNYYPPDSNFSFLLALHEHAEKDVTVVKDSKGNDRRYIRWGEFRFDVGDVEIVLQAYKSEVGEKRLFVPFKDLTSGNETYGAGRYLDMETEECFSGGKWALDFNEAFNPYCAYSHNYACPLVPPENWLKVRIEAGEKS
ncbi:MAG: DUF1684 domain-containing protein [Thermoplasmata archaeon]|nr:DUF1684 domain-containing protein [Thermoplasmata archaeon]